MPRAAWGAVLLALAGLNSPAAAQPGPLAPSGGPPVAQPTLAFDPTVPGAEPPPEPESAPATAVSSNKPPPVLGPPVLGAPVRPAERPPEPSENIRVAGAERGDSPVPEEPVSTPRSGSGRPGEANPGVRRAAALGVPASSATPVAARIVEPTVRTTPAEPREDPVNEFLTKRSGLKDRDTEPRRTPVETRRERSTASNFGEQFGERLHGILGQYGDPWFKSDHCYDGFISPVTNPFLFEDPRSLTEVRPLFIYQKVPSGQNDLNGGDLWFFGTQARVAFTNRLSLVVNKLGGIAINPASSSTFSDETGFAELWLGPKYTFIRGEESGCLLAGGLQFQIPVGSSGAYQSTGTLSLVPWVTYAQSFFRDFRYGSFNTMISTGYSASVNNQRSSYYYLSAHLDLDVMNNHKFYPLMELNWYIYTTDGKTLPIGTEGRDLFNFGGSAAGQGMLTGAFGARYKISESAQIGGAFEFPWAGPKGLFQYRFTIDFILRY